MMTIMASYTLLSFIYLQNIQKKTFLNAKPKKCPKQKRPQKDIIPLLLQTENYTNQHKIRFLQLIHHVFPVPQCLHDS